jgi:hypothetical protein
MTALNGENAIIAIRHPPKTQPKKNPAEAGFNVPAP